MRSTPLILLFFLALPSILSAQETIIPPPSIDSVTPSSKTLEGSDSDNPFNSIMEKANSLYIGMGEKNETYLINPKFRIGIPPDILTSSLPEPEPERVEGSADLDWLQNLALPDIPIRWDSRVVDLLKHYKNDQRGRLLLNGWFLRGKRYKSMILRKIRAMSLPEDLLYVAMVESGYDPTARSRAGALGMWQFIEITADEYGLNRSRWFDQRMNPELSTDAALRYLSDLYKRFGTWELSFAAFNMGYGALLRSIRKYNSNDFWFLSRLEAGLPYETIHYVAKIMACAVIGRNPERFGLENVEDFPTEGSLSTVYVPGGTPFGRLARAVGISKDKLLELNPEIKRGRTPPDVSKWPIRIPAEQHTHFLGRWSRMEPRSPTVKSHTMRFGEELSDVAKMYGTTTYAIRQLNQFEESDEIGPGYKILVPNVTPKKIKQTEPVAVIVPDRKFVYADRRRVFYRVTNRDSVKSISRFFSVSQDELRKWNDIDASARLQRGMILQLFVRKNFDLSQVLVLTPDEVTELVVGSEEFFNYHESQRGRKRIRYRIKPGDTLIRLADRFELSVGSIARINQFSQESTLKIGQEIIIYVPNNQ